MMDVYDRHIIMLDVYIRRTGWTYMMDLYDRRI